MFFNVEFSIIKIIQIIKRMMNLLLITFQNVKKCKKSKIYFQDWLFFNEVYVYSLGIHNATMAILAIFN